MYPIEYRWISVPTPVTNSTIVIDNGSTRKPSCTLRLPTGSHSNRICCTRRSCSGLSNNPANTITAVTNAPPHISVANQPASGSPSLRPNTTSTRKPASGSAGINQTRSTTCPLSLESCHVVGGRARTSAHEGDDDPEADHDLGRRDDEHEEDDDLPADVVERTGERHEREVHGVEHQLDAHEHDERVAADHEPDRTDREQQRPEHEVPGVSGVDVGEQRHSTTSTCLSVVASPSSVSRPAARRARTTAATTAMTRSTDVISNANR